MFSFPLVNLIDEDHHEPDILFNFLFFILCFVLNLFHCSIRPIEDHHRTTFFFMRFNFKCLSSYDSILCVVLRLGVSVCFPCDFNIVLCVPSWCFRLFPSEFRLVLWFPSWVFRLFPSDFRLVFCFPSWCFRLFSVCSVSPSRFPSWVFRLVSVWFPSFRLVFRLMFSVCFPSFRLGFPSCSV